MCRDASFSRQSFHFGSRGQVWISIPAFQGCFVSVAVRGLFAVGVISAKESVSFGLRDSRFDVSQIPGFFRACGDLEIR